MSDALLDKVRERATQRAGAFAEHPALDAIMADVEVALVLARREAMLQGIHHAGASVQGQGPAIRDAYPLPKRTRQVLREEPVPGTEGPLYRWDRGGLECDHNTHAFSRVSVRGDNTALMRHALDLHDRPCRTEEVPADESDPWDEGADWRCNECGRTGQRYYQTAVCATCWANEGAG